MKIQCHVNQMLLLGYDLPTRVCHKISWVAEHIELSGGFEMGRKVGGFWPPRI